MTTHVAAAVIAPERTQAFAAAVQHNCDVVDARHAADMSLCSFLLAMREFFRWERGIAPGEPLDRDAVGNWIAARETRWSRLEDAQAPLRDLPRLRDAGCSNGDAATVDPFHVAAINRELMPQGLLYGAGLVARDMPVFFLARLHASTSIDGVPVVIGGEELARGLVASIGALDRGEGMHSPTIVVRRAALERACWERYDAHTLRPTAHGAMAQVVRHHGLDDARREGRFGDALAQWVDDELERVVLHEWGEYKVGQTLDPAWRDLRSSLTTRRAQLLVRALRDELADVRFTLPALIDRARAIGVHAWFAAHEGLRAALAPAYAAWAENGDDAALRSTLEHAARRLEGLASAVLALHRADGDAASARVERFLDDAMAAPGKPAATVPASAA